MTQVRFVSMASEEAEDYWAGGLDANGHAAEKTLSDGKKNPCRHCLTEIGEGRGMLVLAYRPFPAPQPYAEVSPIFLCADPCQRHPDDRRLPEMFHNRDRLLLRGYGADHRIRYGTGQVVEIGSLERVAEQILADSRVDYIHMRSASNNCYQCRIERA